MLSGIEMLVRPVQPQNAWGPMLVTGSLAMVSGMVTAPPAPVYPMMVIVPSMIV